MLSETSLHMSPPVRERQYTRSAQDPRFEGGQRLKRAIHVARAKAGLTSDLQVATSAGVSYDTLMNWYSGRTVPRGHELRKVAVALETTFAELQAAYEGTEAEPLPLHEAVGALIPVLQALVEELRLTRAEQTVTAELLVDALAALGRPPRLSAQTEAWAQERADATRSRRRTAPPQNAPER